MKLRKMIIFLIQLAFIATFYIAADWLSFLLGDCVAGKPVILASIHKWLLVLCCGLFVWTGKKAAWHEGDWRDLSRVFIVILLADTFLVLLGLFSLGTTLTIVRLLLGVCSFFIAQALLIKRNHLQLKAALTWPNILFGIIILAFSLFFIWKIIYPIASVQFLALAFGVAYILILVVSLWTAFSAFSLPGGYLPKTNSLLTTLGLACFYLCDLTVSFNLSTQLRAMLGKLTDVWALDFQIFGYAAWDGIRIINQNTTWVFYTPALMLLAISFYKFERE